MRTLGYSAEYIVQPVRVFDSGRMFVGRTPTSYTVLYRWLEIVCFTPRKRVKTDDDEMLRMVACMIGNVPNAIKTWYILVSSCVPGHVQHLRCF